MSTLEYRSAVDEPGDTRWWSWLGWAVYLGMSWTWCIGMFLPVLLVRDYGAWGWLVFAIPNVIGAAAVGWINRTEEQSAKTVKAHRLAMGSFSVVTAVFQVFFGVWLIPIILARIPGETRIIDLAVIALWVLLVLWGNGRILAPLWLAACIANMVLVFVSGQVPPPQAILRIPRVLIHGGVPSGLVLLGISTCFGFLTCPHLDVTFHRARQALSPKGARIAFGLGLGLVFASMIVFSLFYADSVLRIFADELNVKNIFIVGLCSYLTIQLAFTIREHLLVSASLIGPKKLAATYLFIACGIVGSFAAFLARSTRYESFSGGEFGYRLLLAWYGLIFPAYVWICMLPGSGVRSPTARQWVVLTIAVLAALPAFWMAFIEQHMQWIVVGVGIPLIARLFVPSPQAIPIQQ